MLNEKSEEKPENSAKRARMGVLLLCGFLIVFGIFVFDHISKASLWSDEATSANIIPYGFTDIWSKATSDAQPVFYIYMLKIWSLIGGDGAFALRLFSAFFAFVLVALIYAVSKEFFGNRVAITASAIAGTNYLLVWYATQVRAYTLVAVLCLLSYYFFCKIMDGATRKQYAGYVAVTVCGLYAHTWFYFIFAAQILCAALFCKRERSVPITFVMVILLAIPGILASMHLNSLGANSWIGEVTTGTVLNSFIFLSYGSAALYALYTFFRLFGLRPEPKPSFTANGTM